MRHLLLPFLAVHGLSQSHAAPEPLPDLAYDFISEYCINCHDDDSAKGDMVLDGDSINWSDWHDAERWTKVHAMLESGDMPPEKEDQPSATERAALLDWLDTTLTENVQPGGTVIRRLNRQEYEQTVSDTLGIPFSVPNSFPPDTEFHGFDNIGEGLILSPPLMEQYVHLATAAADLLLPPAKKTKEIASQSYPIGPGDFTLNFTTGHEIDGILRMVDSRAPLARSSVWPNRFEARASGIYEVEVDLSAFKATQGHVPIVHLLARNTANSAFQKTYELKTLATFKVDSDAPQTFRASVSLERGETVVIHYENGPVAGDQVWVQTGQEKTKYEAYIAQLLLDAFREDPALGAAWMKVGYERSFRGWSWWDKIEKALQQGDLDVASFDPESPEVKAFADQMSKRGTNTVETIDCMHFFKGPGVDIHQMTFTGPTRLIDDEATLAQKKRTGRFLKGRDGRDDRSYTQATLRPTLDKAFRRPVSDAQLEKYVSIALTHIEKGHSFEEGLHLALRASLCSPRFLFREYREGPMDTFDLAARLSYFLTTGPPDAILRKHAKEGTLNDPAVLEAQTRRLLQHNKVKFFLDSFTGQWLDLRLLPQIMPDTRLLNWTEKDLDAITAETELFVSEILRENHPLETFIDPDFIYLNKRNAKLYDIKFANTEEMTRVEIPRGGLRGGLLTQASVLMATANGVDTQPVLRGAWMLENIFGQPTPPPPSNVPAIEPDTTGAKSIRELLDRHKEDASCASCHLRIDPPGFALENFDPIGRWREFYPVYEKKGDKIITLDGLPVDSASVMPDGTPLADALDLKRYLSENIDIFSRCLSDKLLTYATGRPMNYGDHKVIERVVADVAAQGNGFADLIVALVQSESFRNR